MRRPLVPLAWFVVTVGACALAWSAVDQVAARVTDHTPVIGESSIRAALRSSAQDAEATTPTTSPPSGSPDPSSGVGAGAEPAEAADPNPVGTSGAVGTKTSMGAKSTDPVGSDPGDPTPPPSAPPATTPTTPPPPSQNASVIVIGGSVTASCTSGAPALISAIPANGFGTAVSGGAQLLVDFRSATHHSIVEAECEGTHVHWSTGEEADD